MIQGTKRARALSALILFPFTAFTLWCFAAEGTNGFPDAITKNWTSLQIFADLVVAAGFWIPWMMSDARASGRRGAPWAALVLFTGSIGALVYTLVYGRHPGSLSTLPNRTHRSGRVFGAIAFLGLSALTGLLVAVDGLTTLPSTVISSASGIQIFLDLGIMLGFWIVWLFGDATRRGKTPWPWVLFSAALGSFAPLTYLFAVGRSPASHPLSTSSLAS